MISELKHCLSHRRSSLFILVNRTEELVLDCSKGKAIPCAPSKQPHLHAVHETVRVRGAVPSTKHSNLPTIPPREVSIHSFRVLPMASEVSLDMYKSVARGDHPLKWVSHTVGDLSRLLQRQRCWGWR